MSFQKCPLCDGLGLAQVPKDQFALSPLAACTVCEGRRIIHCDTGKPPTDQVEPKFEPMTDAKPEDVVAPANPLDEYTDEEILYYSTPHFDELQAKKEAHEKAVKEQEETQ